MTHFGERLKYQRGLQRLPLIELSEASGIPIEILQEIEAGELLPSKLQLEQLAASAKLQLAYDVLAQWKEAELTQHWQSLGLNPEAPEKWNCPLRRWDCPCCNQAYSTHCSFQELSTTDVAM